MKVEIPDNLKSDIPQTTFGKILSATPVVMAVIATMLAGLSSSEMTRAQYDRSLAAQQQSKAGDQWSFFQAKRLRGALQRSTADMAQLTHPTKAASEVNWDQLIGARNDLKGLFATDAGKKALEQIRTGIFPPLPPTEPMAAEVKAAEDALLQDQPDAEIAAKLQPVTPEQLQSVVVAARDRVRVFEDATEPITKVMDHLADTGVPEFTLARLKYAAQRYEAEARLNQAVAHLYELQVRKSNLSAERHHLRSQRFFYGMLGAQTGVIIATFAMAARKRNMLWGVAAAAGLVALAFAIYVYLYV